MFVNFAGKPCIDAQFTMEVGFSASIGTVLIPKDQNPDSLFASVLKGPYQLFLSDENTSTAIEGLYIKEMEKDFGADGTSVVKITIQDRRWMWKHKFVNGKFNTVQKDGSIFEFERKTTKNLIDILFKALGENSTPLIVGAVPEEDDKKIPPRFTNIDWKFDNPAQELEKIFKEIGLVLALRRDTVPIIHRKGFGASTAPPTFSLVSDKDGKKNWEKPNKIIVVGGKIITQTVTADLINVLRDDVIVKNSETGEITSNEKRDSIVKAKKHIESIWKLDYSTCAKIATWDDTNPSYEYVSGLEMDLSAGENSPEGKMRAGRRQILKDCFLKWFRIPTVEAPASRSGGNVGPHFFQLPILKELPQTFNENKYKYLRRPRIFIKSGEVVRGDASDAVNFVDDGTINPKSPIILYKNSDVSREYIVGDNSEIILDYELGIVKFKKPVGLYVDSEGKKISASTLSKLEDIKANFRFSEPEIKLVYAYEEKDVEYLDIFPYTKNNYTYVYDVQNSSGSSFEAPDSKRLSRIVKRPELRLISSLAVTGLTGDENPFPQSGSFGWRVGELNRKELDATAKLIADETAQSFYPDSGEEKVYAGLWQIETSGLTTSVSWSFDDSGGLTTVKKSSLITAPQLRFRSPASIIGNSPGSIGAEARASLVLAKKPIDKVEELEKQLDELRSEVKRLSSPASGETSLSGFGVMIRNFSNGLLIPISDDTDFRLHTAYCRVIKYDEKIGQYTVDRIGPILDAEWESARKGWLVGGGSGKFLEWTPA